jgi:hypothetical protein
VTTRLDKLKTPAAREQFLLRRIERLEGLQRKNDTLTRQLRRERQKRELWEIRYNRVAAELRIVNAEARFATRQLAARGERGRPRGTSFGSAA